MGKRKPETNERTPIEELLEQRARDIIATCEAIRSTAHHLAMLSRPLEDTKMMKTLSSARSAQFHAEGILSALKDEEVQS